MLAVGPFGLGVPELIIILVIILLVFGATRLADLGGALGKSIREFRRAAREPEEPETSAPSASAPAEGTVTAPVTCSNCGKPVAQNAKFCAECGAPTEAAVN